MTRPVGEIRQAVLQAAEQGVRGTFLELARLVPGVNPACRAELERVRLTCRNLASEGHLERVDKARVPGICRPLTVYAPRRRSGWVTGGPALQDALASWVRG